MQPEVIGGVRLRVGVGSGEWIDLMPNVNVEELADNDKLISVKGVFRLQGSGPETWIVKRLV